MTSSNLYGRRSKIRYSSRHFVKDIQFECVKAFGYNLEIIFKEISKWRFVGGGGGWGIENLRGSVCGALGVSPTVSHDMWAPVWTRRISAAYHANSSRRAGYCWSNLGVRFQFMRGKIKGCFGVLSDHQETWGLTSTVEMCISSDVPNHKLHL
jgi:hypothetical protein